MERSRFLASVIGPALAALGVAFFLNTSELPMIIGILGRNYLTIMMSGFVGLIAGLLIVNCHNVWRGWPAMVTLIGWVLIVTGMVRLIFPGLVSDVAPRVAEHPWIPLIAATVLALAGLFLSYQGIVKRTP